MNNKWVHGSRLVGSWFMAKNKRRTKNPQPPTPNQHGQSLLELIVVIAVGLVIITALVMSSISSLRNNQLAKNQAQATRLAQEGIEKIRIARDRDADVNGYGKFHDLWAANLICPATCYFRFLTSGILEITGASSPEIFTSPDLTPFKRLVTIINTGAANEKQVTVSVTWTDFAGPHESNQTTILIKQ